MSSIFVIAYDAPRPNLGATQLLNYWHRAEGTPQTIDTWGGNPHFIGRFTPTTFYRVPQERGRTLIVPPIIPGSETPTHFIGSFTAPKFNRAINSWSSDGAVPFVIDTALANNHFIGKFIAPTFNRIPLVNDHFDSPPPIVGEAQPHFIGRFTSPTFNRAINSWDTSVGSQPFVVDTVGANPHFISKFTQPTYQRINYQPAFDLSPAIIPDNPVNFIAKFTPPTFYRTLNSWSSDGIPFTVDTSGANPHFIGTFSAPTFNRIGLNSYTSDIPPVLFDTPVNFISKFQSPVFNRIGYSSYDNQGSSQVLATDIPVNFIARHRPTVFYNSVSYISFDTGVPFVPPPPSTLVTGGRQVSMKELDQAMSDWSKRFWQAHTSNSLSQQARDLANKRWKK